MGLLCGLGNYTNKLVQEKDLNRMIALIGAGQLGSRYLQGMAGVERYALRIWVCDPRGEARERAWDRWCEVGGEQSAHEVLLVEGVEELPEEIDLVIVATTADLRPAAVEALSGHSQVRFWILEKVLAQSVEGLARLRLGVAGAEGCWVNTTRRLMRWHRELKQRVAAAPSLSVERSGPQWGLLCNAIHFMDLVAWITGEEVVAVRRGDGGLRWVDAKRPGFLEAEGELEVRFSGGTVLSLAVDPEEAEGSLTIVGEEGVYWLDEMQGRGWSPLKEPFDGELEMQSQLTAPLVEQILTSGTCGLPTFEESAALHQPLLAGLLHEWNLDHPHSPATSLSIT